MDLALISLVIIIIFAFGLASLVKGLVGLGLPPVAMGVLVLVMPPVEAAALLVLPSLVTNVWQAVDGPNGLRILKRLWPMFLTAALATLAGTGLLTNGNPAFSIAILGLVLALYALISLTRATMRLEGNGPRGLGAIVGGMTGLATAATGVSSVPSVLYLQALDLEPRELVQAMGLSFTVSTIALAANLALSGAWSASLGVPVLVALTTAILAMRVGTFLRGRLDPIVFRRVFLIALLLLGVYLAGRGVVGIVVV